MLLPFEYSKSRKFILISLLLLLNSLNHSPKAFPDYFHSINRWSLDCYKQKNIDVCKIALKVVDNFQLYAASKNYNRCQTSLLELEANLIMVILNKYKGKKVFLKNLDNIEKVCGDLLNDNYLSF